MEWISSVTGDKFGYALLLLALAALVVCWKTKSLHPIDMRLLRLVLPMSQIKCKIVNETLSDQSALIGFRMAHGVQCRTLQDAQSLAQFASSKNLPLDLIGVAGDKFDIRSLKLKSDKERSKLWHLLPGAGIAVSAVLFAMLLIVALSSTLLISLKQTDRHYWLGPTEARALFRDSSGERAQFSSSQCASLQDAGAEYTAEAGRDLAILCEVWTASDLEAYIDSELPKQRSAFLFLSILVGAFGLMVFVELRSWFAESELRKLMNEGLGPQEGEPIQASSSPSSP